MNKLKTSVHFLEQHRKYSPHKRSKNNHHAVKTKYTKEETRNHEEVNL